MITGEVGSDLSLYVGSTSRPSFVPKEIHFGRSVCAQHHLENLTSVVATSPQVLTKFILCNLLGQSIRTSMQNLESVSQKMAELLHNYVIS